MDKVNYSVFTEDGLDNLIGVLQNCKKEILDKDKLLADAEPYLMHTSRCEKRLPSVIECTCGVESILDRIKGFK